MELVKITHPDPGVGDVEVPEQSIGHWNRAGWRRAGEAPAEQPGADDKTSGSGEPAAAGSKEQTPRRRRRNEEG